jgi:hypothetical protein
LAKLANYSNVGMDNTALTGEAGQEKVPGRSESRTSLGKYIDTEKAQIGALDKSMQVNAIHKLLTKIRAALESNVDDLDTELKEKGIPTPKGKPERQFLLIQHELATA